jgi:hypothetical protein
MEDIGRYSKIHGKAIKKAMRFVAEPGGFKKGVQRL